MKCKLKVPASVLIVFRLQELKGYSLTRAMNHIPCYCGQSSIKYRSAGHYSVSQGSVRNPAIAVDVSCCKTTIVVALV